MAVSDPYYSQRVCNCCNCSFLKCTGKQTDAGGYGYFYYCDIMAGDFPYGYNCIFHDGLYKLMRIFKIYATINHTVDKKIEEPYYVFGPNIKTAKTRFKKELPLLEICTVEQCTIQEAISILQSENIEII